MKLNIMGGWEWDIYDCLVMGLGGIYGLNGWGSYGKVSCCFWGEYAQKCWSSGEYPFRSSHDHVDWKMIPLKSTRIVKKNCGKSWWLVSLGMKVIATASHMYPKTLTVCKFGAQVYTVELFQEDIYALRKA